jgi:hypothetical protein
METEIKITLADSMRDDMNQKLKRLSSLVEQRAMQEQILKNLTREINGLEAVVGYIKATLAKDESTR